MTTVAVLARAPDDDVLPALVEAGVVSGAEASDLYAAMLADVCEAVAASGGDLLVNYREGSEAAVREAVEVDARFEVQVGSTAEARIGNTVTHLLTEEGEASVAVVRPSAALLARKHVDSAAMKLRTNDLVVGPATAGGVHYAGFGEPIDFEEAYADPAVETLVRRGLDAGLSVDFLPSLPTLDSVAGLKTARPLLRARRGAGHQVPTRTADALDAIDVDLQ